ncbi:MAG TPA: FISUMP domain-containing protein [Stellaceae bacterium]|nr:FISUMP domain-containing protein [Stellaceae bacterium]
MSITAPIGFTVNNPALDGPVIEVGVTAALDVVLTNATGAEIGIQASPPSTLLIFGQPTPVFTAAELQAMTIDLAGWTLSVDAAHLALILKATANATWAAADAIRFTIKGVKSTQVPASKFLNINPSNLTGRVPLNISAPLLLKAPPKPGNASLADILQVNLDNQGSIYRSAAGDPLINSLFLNIKNTAAVPVFSGAQKSGQPSVSATFVYARTAGGLAPDDRQGDTAPQGSAWNIVANPKVSPATPWGTTNPDVAGGQPHPAWILTPASVQILGTDENANVTFEFSNIISFTPVGHTQMYLLFTGFMKDATTAYDDHVFVLDIVKQDAPPTRGLLSFHAEDPIVELHKPGESATLRLRWGMLDVARVQLLPSSPAIPPLVVRYPNPEPLAYDSTSLTVPPKDSSEPLFLSLQSYDGNNGFLNALQFTVYVRVAFVRDKAGRAYPVALLGDTLWMTENYAYAAHGSYDYGSPTEDAQFGRLYEWESAVANAPDGWSVPTPEDWTSLLNRFGSAGAAYGQLIQGGDAGFNAVLGGYADDGGNPSGTYARGVYWTARSPNTAQFVSGSKTLTVGVPLPASYAASVRYVRRA